MRLLEQIDSIAQLHPQRPAFQNEALAGDGSITYGELTHYAGRLARQIEDAMGEDHAPVLVYGHKSPWMLVCFLGCVKSGRAYCPVDTSVPPRRLSGILEEAGASLVLSTEDFPCDAPRLWTLSEIRARARDSGPILPTGAYVQGEDLFYIIFTSGSTGTPKGVQITCRCLENFVSWARTLGDGRMGERPLRFLNQAPFSFDLSVMDTYLCLSLGGTLWALDRSVQDRMGPLYSSLARSGAQVWVSTPSFADFCLADSAFSQRLMPDLELFLFCGETLQNRTAAKLLERFPRAQVVNTYGPTESTVAMTQVTITPALCAENAPLPVGVPRPGSRVEITGPGGRILPDGARGEIVITGDTVSPGYYRRPALTAPVFSPCPGLGPHIRRYRTGDMGFLMDGMLYYCGRMDLQIKYRGYRIEVEDIERQLCKLSEVKAAVVLPVKRGNIVRSLAAFVVFSPGVSFSSAFAAARHLRPALAALLPDYMIPKTFHPLDAIPMTPSGKADRKRLAAMQPMMTL